jgi:hypothetical protein
MCIKLLEVAFLCFSPCLYLCFTLVRLRTKAMEFFFILVFPVCVYKLSHAFVLRFLLNFTEMHGTKNIKLRAVVELVSTQRLFHSFPRIKQTDTGADYPELLRLRRMRMR